MKYSPSFLLRNGHFNTVFPTLFRRQDNPEYIRKRLFTEDDDFLDVDMLAKGNSRLAILCHGLEGSSHSSYIVGTGRLLSANAWDVAAINYRSCSDEMNRQLIMYHSGATYDLDFIVRTFIKDYDEIAIIGFSLGGNLALKYAGEKKLEIDPKIKSVVGISVPVDLKAGSLHIGKWSNYIYEKRFLVTLTDKIRQKAEMFPGQIDMSKLKKTKSLFDFDNYFTGPIHGFDDAYHYYAVCSSKAFIKDIQLPSLIINAMDDPFLPPECYPEREVAENPLVQLNMPRHGGHVGFVQRGQNHYWNEEMILSFINRHDS